MRPLNSASPTWSRSLWTPLPALCPLQAYRRRRRKPGTGPPARGSLPPCFAPATQGPPCHPSGAAGPGPRSSATNLHGNAPHPATGRQNASQRDQRSRRSFRCRGLPVMSWSTALEHGHSLQPHNFQAREACCFAICRAEPAFDKSPASFL